MKTDAPKTGSFYYSTETDFEQLDRRAFSIYSALVVRGVDEKIAAQRSFAAAESYIKELETRGGKQ